MTRIQTLKLEHTETLLDVVFGVVIALPLIGLPVHVQTLLLEPDTEKAVIVFLSMSALIFSAFYWLEVRHFLEEQQRFNEAIGSAAEGATDGVPLPLATFLLGSLAMMAIAAGVLSFAEDGLFRSFMIANLLYWTADCFGTVSLKHTYRPFAAAIASVRAQSPEVYGWFAGHIESRYFYVYGVGNIVVFASLLVLDVAFGSDGAYRVTASVFTVVYVLFRHLGWRARLYWWWIHRSAVGQSQGHEEVAG